MRALKLYAGSLYVGGTFWKIGDRQPRRRRSSGSRRPVTLKDWNPETNWGIYALLPAPDGSGMFIGGPFDKIGDASHKYLAKVNAGTGALTSWTYPLECTDPDPVPLDLCEVFGMVTDGSTLYVAAGGPGGRLTALNVATGAAEVDDAVGWRFPDDRA